MVGKMKWSAAIAAVVMLCGIYGCGGDQPAPKPKVRPRAGGVAKKTDDAPPANGAAAPVAEGWGDLTMRMVYDGTPPAPARISITKDTEYCGMHDLVDEELIVGEDGGLANVVLWLRDKNVKVHPDYEATAGDEVELDNKNCRYDPHVQLMRTSQKLLLKNTDTIGHNVKGDCLVNPAFNEIVAAEGQTVKTLPKEERFPVRVGCNIHPWMSGWLVVRDDPYMAVSDENGNLTIKNLPAGEYEFQFWQEKAGFLDGFEVQGKKPSKGRVKLTVNPGENDLGEIKVPASALAK